MIVIKQWHTAKTEKVKHMSAKKLEVIIEAILNHTKMIVFPTTWEAVKHTLEVSGIKYHHGNASKGRIWFKTI